MGLKLSAHLVEAIVEADDAVLGHGVPDQCHQARGRHRQSAVVRALRHVQRHLPRYVRKVPAPCLTR